MTVRTPPRGAVVRSAGDIPATLRIWAVGAAAFLSRSLLHWYRVRRIACQSVPLPEGREVRLLRALERGTRPLTIVSSDTSLEPGVFGILRPVLLWPRRRIPNRIARI